jgi:hypothetical protein
MCPACLRVFSIDGHNAHLVGGCCSYSSAERGVAVQVIRGKSIVQILHIGKYSYIITAPLHPAEDSQNPPLQLQAYLSSSSFTLFEVPDFTYSAIGRALMEWNSRVGVPYLVWHTISTARVYCPGCDRVRSFDGDLDHRKRGECGLAGLCQVSRKGKERVMDK